MIDYYDIFIIGAVIAIAGGIAMLAVGPAILISAFSEDLDNLQLYGSVANIGFWMVMCGFGIIVVALIIVSIQTRTVRR